jgi:UDP-N-acetylglucosamine:LPS N-acetylglucosamine transferase
VLLVCSTGGHLLQLHLLRGAWNGFNTTWVTFDKSDARSLLAGEQVVYAHGPTNRNIPNLLRNLMLAFRLVRRMRPRVVVSTGAGLAVPFAWVGRLYGARIVYVESVTRIESPSLSLRLITPVVSRTYAQWPELAARVGARYVGSVFDSP